MPPEAGSPQDWLRFAYSDLDLAKTSSKTRVMLETLCFHAQQAVEKCFKAILLQRGIPFPKTHNLKILFELFPSELQVPSHISEAVMLTDYAVTARYPGEYEPVTSEEYRRVIAIAEEVVSWTETVLSSDTD